MIIRVKIIPKSSQTEMSTLADGTIKIKLKSPPVEGKANEELVKFLSEYYKVSKSSVVIKKGLTSKNKVIEI